MSSTWLFEHGNQQVWLGRTSFSFFVLLLVLSFWRENENDDYAEIKTNMLVATTASDLKREGREVYPPIGGAEGDQGSQRTA